MASQSTISYVSGEQLAGLQGPKIAVVDVRDDERAFDGHIAGSVHFCSADFEEALPKLVEEVKNKEIVVFHCSFSQVRGPTCARFLSEHLNKAASEGKLEKLPNIVVLERGFNGWAESGRPELRLDGQLPFHIQKSDLIQHRIDYVRNMKDLTLSDTQLKGGGSKMEHLRKKGLL